MESFSSITRNETNMMNHEQLGFNINSPANLTRRSISMAIHAGLLGLGLVSAQAATVTVNSLVDEIDTNIGSDCTLRKAIETINQQATKPGCVNTGAEFGEQDTIHLSSALNDQTITLAGQQLEIGDAGPDASPLEVLISASNVTIDANQQSRGIQINSGNRVSIEGVNILNGAVPDNGAGIHVPFGSELTLSNSVISDNFAQNAGGGLFSNGSKITINNARFENNISSIKSGAIDFIGEQNVRITNSHFNNNKTGYLADGSVAPPVFRDPSGGAISLFFGPKVIIENSFFDRNTSRGSGGAIELYSAEIQLDKVQVSNNASQFDGGAIQVSSASKLRAVQSTFSNNQSVAGDAGAISAKKLQTGAPEVELVQSTLSANSAGRNGGAIYLNGGQLGLANSTVSGNQATASGGGLYAGAESATLSVLNSTFNNNSAASVGGVLLPNSAGISITIQNSIIANSTGGDCQINGPLKLDSATLIEDGSCGASNLGDPGLQPLANNGGPTQTHAISSGSPVLNAGDATTCLSVDQRGQTRELKCDLGAFESSLQPDGTFFVIPIRNGNTVIFEL